MSIISFVLYGWDKQQARNGFVRYRISERTLLSIDLLFGWPGGLLAQQFFRHKVRKISYRKWFHLIIVLHIMGWILLLFWW